MQQTTFSPLATSVWFAVGDSASVQLNAHDLVVCEPKA